MDEADRASELEQERIRKSLVAIAIEMKAENPDIECIECGEEIEEERRRILPSARRCYLCQELHERPRRVKRL
jgi:DnaK suppressor protein